MNFLKGCYGINPTEDDWKLKLAAYYSVLSAFDDKMLEKAFQKARKDDSNFFPNVSKIEAICLIEQDSQKRRIGAERMIEARSEQPEETDIGKRTLKQIFEMLAAQKGM